MQKRYLECGKIVSLHGVRGEVKAEVWADSPDYLGQFSTLYLDKGETPIRVLSARPHKNMALLLLEGFSTPEAAGSLRGKILYLDREDAPDDGKPFLQDLLGLAVSDIDTGRDYGAIKDVIHTGANDVYVLKDSTGTERLIPVIPDVVIETDIPGGTMKIRPLKGLFEDEEV